MAPLPSRVNRRPPTLGDEARQRVLRRAIELAQSSGDSAGGDDESVLTEAAAELGVGPELVRQALAEERAGLLAPAPATLLDRLAGPGVATATMQLRHHDPLRAVGLWLERAHSLRRVTADDQRGIWVRRTDMVASTRRAVAGLSGNGRLGDRHEVRVTVTPAAGTAPGAAPAGGARPVLDASPAPDARPAGGTGAALDGAGDTGAPTWLVRLEADVRRQRVLHVGTGATVSGAGLSIVALGASGAVLLVPAAIVGAPAAVGGLLLVGSNRARVRRVEVELLRVLDAVARGQSPHGPLDAMQALLGRNR